MFSVCKYICHKTCEDKVSKHTYATPSWQDFIPERGAIRCPVPGCIVSHELVYTIRQRLLGNFATEWIPGEPFARTRRDTPASVHDSPSYFLVLEQISPPSPPPLPTQQRPTKRSSRTNLSNELQPSSSSSSTYQ